MHLQTTKYLLNQHEQRAHLLLYDGHWMAITNLSALYRRNKVSGSFKMCNTCLATFHNVQPYLNHLPCHPDRYIQTENMPHDDLEFKEFHKCVDLSDIVYADMESILVKCAVNDDNDDAVVNTNLQQKHIPCCVGSYWNCKVPETQNIDV